MVIRSPCALRGSCGVRSWGTKRSFVRFGFRRYPNNPTHSDRLMKGKWREAQRIGRDGCRRAWPLFFASLRELGEWSRGCAMKRIRQSFI